MKKLFLFALLLLAAPLCKAQGSDNPYSVAGTAFNPYASAQISDNAFDYSFSMRGGVAYFPTVPVACMVGMTLGIIIAAPIIAIAQGMGGNNSSNGETSTEEGTTKEFPLLPAASLELQYIINKRIAAGVDIGYYSSDIIKKKETGEIVSRENFVKVLSVMPQFRLNYLPRKNFCLYGTAAIGALYFFDDNKVYPGFQINPFGMEFGKNVFGYFEIGVGSNYFGVRTGLGFRF